MLTVALRYSNMKPNSGNKNEQGGIKVNAVKT
jgi:hypothetical protein